MYIESRVSVFKLDFQCNDNLLLPFFLITLTIGRLNHWWIFSQSIPCIWYCCWKPLSAFILLYVLAEHLFHHVKCIEVIRIRWPIFLSNIIRDIFIEIIGDRVCCVATSPTLLNSELLFTTWSPWDVSSAFSSNNCHRQLLPLLQIYGHLFLKM